MNRLYEGMFLLDANETSKRWNEMESHIDALFGKIDASVQFKERWPSQKLAYEVKGTRKGTYYLTYFHAAPDKIDDLRRDAELSEHILRFMVIQEDWLEEEMGNRMAAAERRAEPKVADSDTTKEDESPSEQSPETEERRAEPKVADSDTTKEDESPSEQSPETDDNAGTGPVIDSEMVDSATEDGDPETGDPETGDAVEEIAEAANAEGTTPAEQPDASAEEDQDSEAKPEA